MKTFTTLFGIVLSVLICPGLKAQQDPVSDMIKYLEENMVVAEGVNRAELAAQLKALIELQIAQVNAVAPAPGYANSKEGVVRFATDFAKGDRNLILAALPTQEETRMICATAADAAMVDRYLEMFRSQIPATGLGQLRKEGQTEIQVMASNSTALLEGRDQILPGGYSQTAKRFRPGLNFYAFRYAKPGESLGMRYDVCVFVNGRLVFIPKMWRAFP